MNKPATRSEPGRDSVTVGAGTEWEQERGQSSTPQALAARDEVSQGTELTRVLSRADQDADGAQPWTLTPRESIERMGTENFNQTYGVAGATGREAAPLSSPVLLTGRMPADGQFVTTEALKEYGSRETLPSTEVVASPNTVQTTGAYDLSPRPTYGEQFPPDLKELQQSGALPSQQPFGQDSAPSNTNNPIPKETAMPAIANETRRQPEPASGPAPTAPPGDSSKPPGPPDLSQGSFGKVPHQIGEDYKKENPRPSALAQEVAGSHTPEPQPSPAPAPTPGQSPESPSR